MTVESPTATGLGVVVATLCECELSGLLDEIGGRATVEVVELSGEPTRAEVTDLVARLDGRRLAVRAEGTVGLDLLIQRLRDQEDTVPFALLPCPADPPGLVVAGAPDAGDSGVAQLLAGEPQSAGILRSDHGEFVAATNLMLVRAGVTDVLEPFEARISIDGHEVFSGTVDGDIHLSAEFGRLHVETTADGDSLTWTGAEVVVRAGTPIEVFDACVGKKPARLRHTWTIEPDGFPVYAGEHDVAAPDVVDVLLLACGDSDVDSVLDELDGQASVEVVRLPEKPSREEIAAALARAGGRRVALRAGHESFEVVVHHLHASATWSRTPLAVLPDPGEPVHLGPDGAPFNESGVSQLISGTVAAAPVLRGEAGERALSVNLWDSGPEETTTPFEAKIWVDDRQVFDDVSDGLIRISLDVVGQVEVEFALDGADSSTARRRPCGLTMVTVESPALLEAADSVEIKGTGHRHVWTVDPDGFDIYVGSVSTREPAQPEQDKAAEEQARRERMLADPPPATTSTGVLLLRMVVPILLVYGISALAFSLLALNISEFGTALVWITALIIMAGGWMLSGRRLVDSIVALVVSVFYLIVGFTSGPTIVQSYLMQERGQEIQAVVDKYATGGYIVTTLDGTPVRGIVSADTNITADHVPEDRVDLGDRVTVAVDPKDQMDPMEPGDIRPVFYGALAALVAAVLGYLFIRTGLSWRRRRREDYAEYLTLRDEQIPAKAVT